MPSGGYIEVKVLGVEVGEKMACSFDDAVIEGIVNIWFSPRKALQSFKLV